MNKYLLMYHKEDNDGLFSCAIILNELLKKDSIDKFDLIGANYVDMNRLEESLHTMKENYEYVILTDISFSAKAMKQLFNDFGSKFIWFDHHRPIIKESFKLKFDDVSGLRDTNHSALYNAWMYYNNPLKDENIKMPKIYDVLSAWDSFTFEQNGYSLEYVKQVNVGANMIYDLKLDKILKLVIKIDKGEADGAKAAEDLLTIGKICVAYDDQRNVQLVANSGDPTWLVDGRRAIALFMCGPTNSEMFKSLVDTNIENAIVFKVTGEEKVTVSLYNIHKEDDYDCGAYMMKKYKGGGHVGAAGCQISKSKYIKLLKTKSF